MKQFPLRSSLLLATALMTLMPPALAASRVICEIHWSTSEKEPAHLEFILKKKGCAMEGEQKSDCYLSQKSEGTQWTLGEGVIRKGVSAETLCLAPRLMELANEKVTLNCDQKKKPRSVTLEGPQGIKKTCPLPKEFP